jgi:phage baseplate assembly protein W
METVFYRGYSSKNFEETKTFININVETVKQDILNHIFTIKGERIMLPNFGTTIPEMAFEPLDDLTINTVESELMAVVNYDPRVSLISMNVQPLYDQNMLLADLELKYLELDIIDNMNLRIEFGEN